MISSLFFSPHQGEAQNHQQLGVLPSVAVGPQKLYWMNAAQTRGILWGFGMYLRQGWDNDEGGSSDGFGVSSWTSKNKRENITSQSGGEEREVVLITNTHRKAPGGSTHIQTACWISFFVLWFLFFFCCFV